MYRAASLTAIAVFALLALSRGKRAEVIGIFDRRGINNNNPGNLVKTAINWKGKVPHNENTDNRFEQFTRPEWGIRAMYIDIKGDIENDGSDTLEKLISEYAPRHENDTESYIDFVSKRIGLARTAPITPEYYEELVKAIIFKENGVQPYSDDLIQEAIALA